MICDPQAFELNEEQKKELLNLTGDFLAKHFSKEVISTLQVEIKFSRKQVETLLRVVTHGCVSSPGADDGRCPENYVWSE